MNYDWSSPENVRHSIRVMCDAAGMGYVDKNTLTACVYQESEFNPRAIGKPNSNGTQDFGLAQYNNGSINGIPLWIGPGAAFASTDEVLNNPAKNIRIMILQFKSGHRILWSSYKTGAYIQWMRYITKPVPPVGHY